MSEDNTLFEAMSVFATITQAAELTSNEVALFHTLLSTWNSARRPTVIEQWARNTRQASGVSERSLPDARNKLIQRGVIFYSKEGNRSVPRYSLNAIFNLPSPFLPTPIPAINDSKRVSKPVVKVQVNRYSYQEEEKEEGKTSAIKRPSMQEFIAYCIPKLKTINDDWTSDRATKASTLKFETYVADKWKDGNGKPIKNWKTKAINSLKFEKPWTYGSEEPSSKNLFKIT